MPIPSFCNNIISCKVHANYKQSLSEQYHVLKTSLSGSSILALSVAHNSEANVTCLNQTQYTANTWL